MRAFHASYYVILAIILVDALICYLLVDLDADFVAHARRIKSGNAQQASRPVFNAQADDLEAPFRVLLIRSLRCLSR